MNLEDIMVSEIRQSQKEKYCIISFMCESKKIKLIKAENKMVVTSYWGVGKMGKYWSQGTFSYAS